MGDPKAQTVDTDLTPQGSSRPHGSCFSLGTRIPYVGHTSCTLQDLVAPGLGRCLLHIFLSYGFSGLGACQARVIMGALPLPSPPAHHLPEKSLSRLLLLPVLVMAWDWGFLTVWLLPTEPEALGQASLPCGSTCILLLSCMLEPQAALQ